MNRWSFMIILWVILADNGHAQTCTGLDAGKAELIAKSSRHLINDRTGEQVGGSQFTIKSENFDLTGDPDPTTSAGIRFLVFRKQPDLDEWITPEELVDHPDIIRVDGDPLLAGTDESGTINIGERPAWELPFGQLVPVRLWFVPITVHHVNAPDFESAFEGPCINVNGDNPISIYFVLPLKLELDLNYWDRETNEIIIPVSGGLPELEPDRFEYELKMFFSNTKEKVFVEKRGFNLFVFKMDSLYGTFDITLGTKGFLSQSVLTDLTISKPLVRLTIPDMDVYQGDEFCLPVRVRDFWNIDSFTFRLQWDESVIEFTGFGPPGNIHPELKKGSGPVFHRLSGRNGGRFTWETNGDPVTIPDGDVLFNLCFKAVGHPGSRTPVDTLGDDHRFYGGELFLGPRVEAGEVRIIPDDYLGMSYEMLSCPETSGPVDVVMDIMGKHPPFTLSFDPADTEDRIMEGNRDTLYGIPQGTYDITLTDALGQSITKIDQEFSTGFQGDFRLTLDSVRSHDPLCVGDANGEIFVKIHQNKSLNYNLFYQKGNDTIEVDNPLMKDLGAGEYTIWAVDERGCEAPLPEPVVLDDPVPMTLAPDNIRLACGATDSLVRLGSYVEGGTGVVEYAMGDDGQYRRLERDTVLEAGTYTIHLRDFLGCEATANFTVGAGASDISFTFDPSEDTLFVEPDETVEVASVLSGSDTELTYDWSASGGTVDEFVENKARFSFEENGTIRLTITDPSGCDFSDELPVVVSEQEEPDGEEDDMEDEETEKECTVSIPNAITPNGDGINDYLEIFSSCSIQVIHIRIFDKWGGELYQVQGVEVETQLWEDLPPGVVMVQVTYQINTSGGSEAGVVKTIADAVMVVK